MGDYNPRQITQMRWKDAKELEKFKFISGEFDVTNNTIEQASKHKPWSKIVEVIKNGSAYKPVLIFDISNNEFYFGTQENDALYLQTLYADQGYALEIQYDYTTDKLTITSTEKNYLIDADAPKMYRHELFINSATFIIYSPNQLNISSTQDLTTVVKPDGFSTFMGAIHSSDLPVLTVVLYYDNGIWKINDGSVTNVTTIQDHVILL